MKTRHRGRPKTQPETKVAKTLSDYMDRSGLTREQFAVLAGTTKRTIINCLQGKNISARVAKKILTRLGRPKGLTIHDFRRPQE